MAAPGPAPGGGAAPVSPRQPRRGPAPFASFDHDVSDEVRPDSSPEKPTFQLPEILEHSAGSNEGRNVLAVEGRARSASTPGPVAAGALQAAPRIDISRASSSSHHDSRDSSPEMALFAGDPPARLEAAFREDAQDLRSSTEELAFLEQPAPPAHPPPPAPAPSATALPPRRHSRKDSQGSEAALLGVGRSSRLGSVGSQCSAVSALSGCSRLSVASATSRSPSPHKMLLETSFCGPKPIDTDVELCAAAVERCLLEMSLPALVSEPVLVPGPATAPNPATTTTSATVPAVASTASPAHARCELRAEVTVEPPPATRSALAPATAPAAPVATIVPDKDKSSKESRNRRARSRERRAESRDQPEVYRAGNRSKDIIRIKLRPDEESEDHEDEQEEDESPPKPASLELRAAPRARDSRTPSPAAGAHSRKSSFCSLFKSRETIASPESPAGRARKRSPERSRSKSRERTSARGSVLSLFRGARRSRPASPAEPAPAPAAPAPVHVPPPPGGERLPYYEPATIIHIPLRTPPAGAPTSTATPAALGAAPPRTRTVLPDGSIIIPLHSPTEKCPAPELVVASELVVAAQVEPARATSPPRTVGVTREERAVIETAPPRATSPPSPRARRSRLQFTTQVGSHEQVFSTQLSITHTPSVSSELSLASNLHADQQSGNFPAEKQSGSFHAEPLPTGFFDESQSSNFTNELQSGNFPIEPPSGSFPARPQSNNIIPAEPNFANFPAEPPAQAQALRDTHITTVQPQPPTLSPDQEVKPFWSEETDTKDSSESSASSEGRLGDGGGSGGGGTGCGVSEDAEQRGLVVQESFEDELPYVPTTLPLERPVALPMVPVAERGGLRVARVERPRPSGPPAPSRTAVPPPGAATAAAPGEKLRISLPRRPRAASTPFAERARAPAAAPAPAPGWIDFEELPERRVPAKRIQTLPAAAAAAGSAGEEPQYNYVEPEHCRCECHGHSGGEGDAH